MDLDERKKKILKAVIKNYLDTGEPVGSRTISKFTDLNLSSATIRNEMADLEELGYILQPHTSAGRIPSDKGYRFYVDTMMEEKDKSVDDIKELLLEKEDRMERLLQQVVKLLAQNTNYTTMISAPRSEHNKLKFIQLSRVDAFQILAVIVIDGNVIKNKIMEVKEELDDETLLKLNLLFNTHLNGLAISDINLGMISKLKAQAGSHGDIVDEVIDSVAGAIQAEEEPLIYTSGTNNILKYPELSDKENVGELISTIEEKNLLSQFVHNKVSEGNETGIQVYIGNETPIQSMKDCSVVTATYELEEGLTGTIGIVGPKRMDYEKVVGTLNTLKSQLDDLYRK